MLTNKTSQLFPNDGKCNSTQNRNEDIRNKFIGDFFAYMRDCNFTIKEARAYSNIICAIAISYRPLPDFWRRLDTDTVVSALSAYTMKETFTTRDAYREHVVTMKQVIDYLFMNQHDELNAELLAQLPPSARPTDEWEASDWICSQHEKRGDIKNLEYAERDGHKCGRAALKHLARLEAAANGERIQTADAVLAQCVRKDAMARPARTCPIETAADVSRGRRRSKPEILIWESDGTLRSAKDARLQALTAYGQTVPPGRRA
jgi:hypothetical protein